MEKHDHMVDASVYAFKAIEQNKRESQLVHFRKKNYWRGFKVGLIIGLVLACACAVLALYAARGWRDEIRATNYYYNLSKSYDNQNK